MKARLLAAAGSGLVSALLANTAAAAGDHPPANAASPDQYEVLLENPEVLVLKMVLEPGESDNMHSHMNETVYFERGGTLTITGESGDSMVAEVPDGHVMWHRAWSHQVTNTGSSTVVAIIVEDKP